MIRFFTLFLLIALTARAEDDEVRFKPKRYATGKTLLDRSYQASAYTPSDRPSSSDKRYAASGGGFWGLFKSKGLDDGKRLTDAPSDKGAAYKQEKQISVPTISADPGIAADHTPFEDAGKKLTDPNYKAPEKPLEKNPLLKPRQGIKESAL